nr:MULTISPECIES: GH25 family lysozyme [Bacillus]
MGIKGIDVSHWQGNINWKKVAGDGIKFALSKQQKGQH